ncbi:MULTISPECIES: flavodoxin [unclassified Methanoregula]|uniref:flavodoxin family protein n=1 Tax=unclassified Methanoregula TaxID=2649730 RepID=UPI0009D3735D|nr:MULTISPECIES: flavodoxin [unclassified Methanoregula]OPX62848.1 MAG: flavodoxin [Methanoregula sp. PtaB.Bin085]OPY35285.1 MAG: flavodoxin [Methanoregula sp. PtaU1.Bin006]
MKTSIIYNSYSGNTRGVAEKVQAACGGTLVEVKSKQYSSKLAVYTLGCYRAMKEMSDPIEPERIDVTSDDVIVIGTPIWAGKATPAVNAAIASLQGCAGKKAIIFATCGKEGKDALAILRTALGARGVTVAGEFVFDKDGMKDPARIDAMIAAVKTAGGSP